jgi:hypothetical protein
MKKQQKQSKQPARGKRKSSRTMFPFLPYLIRSFDAYISGYQYDYIKTLKPNLTDEEFNLILKLCVNERDPNYFSGTYENPNFIKFG